MFEKKYEFNFFTNFLSSVYFTTSMDSIQEHLQMMETIQKRFLTFLDFSDETEEHFENLKQLLLDQKIKGNEYKIGRAHV